MLAVCVLPAVSAAQGTLHGSAALGASFEGTPEADVAGAEALVSGQDGRVTLRLQDAQGTATRIVHRSFGYANSHDPRAEVLWDSKVERLEVPLDGALLTLAERRSAFQLLLYDADARVSAAGDAPLALAAPEGEAVVQSQRPTDAFSVRLVGEQEPFVHTIPATGHVLSGDAGRITVDGAFRVFIADAVLEHYAADGSGSESIPAHFRVEERPGAVYNPLSGQWMGDGTHREYVEEYLVIEGDGHVEVLFTDVPATVHGETLAVTSDRATLPEFTGTVAVPGEDGGEHELRGQDLELGGRFTLNFHHADGGRSQVWGSGEITLVSYGAVVASYDWTIPVAVGAGAAIVAGAVAWLVGNGKTLLGGGAAAVAGYARVQGPAILEHPARSELYERIKAQPGVSFVQLAQAMGAGESTVTHHLRVLERNGFVTPLKDGRHLRFFDRHNGHYAASRKHAVSALRNETTAAIARRIVQRPGMAQCDLATEFNLAASTVNWHIRRLSQVGLVDARRDHPHTRYYAGQAWATLPPEEQVRAAAAAPVPVVAAVAPTAV